MTWKRKKEINKNTKLFLSSVGLARKSKLFVFVLLISSTIVTKSSDDFDLIVHCLDMFQVGTLHRASFRCLCANLGGETQSVCCLLLSSFSLMWDHTIGLNVRVGRTFRVCWCYWIIRLVFFWRAAGEGTHSNRNGHELKGTKQMSSNFSISKFQKGTLPYSVSLLFFSIFFSASLISLFLPMFPLLTATAAEAIAAGQVCVPGWMRPYSFESKWKKKWKEKSLPKQQPV